MRLLSRLLDWLTDKWWAHIERSWDNGEVRDQMPVITAVADDDGRCPTCGQPCRRPQSEVQVANTTTTASLTITDYRIS